MTLLRSDIDRLHQATAVLLNDLSKRVSALEFSRKMGMDKHKLEFFFREYYGKPFIAYLDSKRMEAAAVLLLEEEKPIKETSRLLGFKQDRYFIVAFKRHFGVTPGAFRKQMSSAIPFQFNLPPAPSISNA